MASRNIVFPKRSWTRKSKAHPENGSGNQTGVTFGKDISLKSIKADKYKAVLATGLHLSRRLNIDNCSTCKGYLKGLIFLEMYPLNTLFPLGKEWSSFGGGNVAIDVALTAVAEARLF